MCVCVCVQERDKAFESRCVKKEATEVKKEFCCCFSVTKSCPTLCDPMDCSMPGFIVLHCLPEFAQIHVHWINDGIQPSHPLLPSSPWDSLVSQMVKNLPTMEETQVQSLVWKIPWRREWLYTPVFLPGEFHGQRNLAGYSPWDCKESDMSEQLTHTKGILGNNKFNNKFKGWKK